MFNKKGLILIPKFWRNKVIPLQRYKVLFEKIVNELNFDIDYRTDIDPNKIEADVVLVFRGPTKFRPYWMRGLQRLPKNIKLISYVTDIHDYNDGNLEFFGELIRLFERSDVILCPYDHTFKNSFPQFTGKYEFFPSFFAPYKHCAEMKFNNSPIMKCLLSGSTSWVHELRDYIRKNMDERIDLLLHPLYKRRYGQMNDNFKADTDYLDHLNKYFCCVTCPLIYEYSVGKYFEIPSTGSLLVAKPTPDLKKKEIGLIGGEHYVPVNIDNFFDKLDEVLNNKKKYDEMRYNTKEMVLRRHSELNRFDQFCDILEEL